MSIDTLAQSARAASTDEQRMRSTGELGASLLQARRFDQAAGLLRDAYSFFSGADRARYAIDLGNLALIRKREKDAQQYYLEALDLAGEDTEIRISARLNLARLAPQNERLKRLTDLFEEINGNANASSRARFFLNLGNQAQALGPAALSLAYRSFDQARQLSADGSDNRLRVESLDALAQLYEDNGRRKEALVLTQQAIAYARALTPGAAGDLLIVLEWRQGRLHDALGNQDLALTAFQRAVDQIEMLRQDIPIEYEDGSSSFRRTLEPVYLGLVERLLQASDKESGDAKAAYLRRVRDAVELIKQAELQDYLGDRCTVDAVKGGTATVIPAGTAVLYPIILSDRIELLLETSSDIVRFSSRVAGPVVRRIARAFANDLRDGSAGYMSRSRQLYDWLFRPLEGFIAERRITTVVVVPDGALRLVAMGALHDGNQFAIERLAITTVTGLSMTNTSSPSTQGAGLLVAGISDPGPVVEKLSQANVEQLLDTAIPKRDDAGGLAQQRALRSLRLRSGDSISALKSDPADRIKALREALALPGVKGEVEAISRISRSTSMLNEPFTVEGFRRATESGAYRVVHVASHGVFGGTADSSYVLAYDDLLTLDGLESLLKSDKFRRNPIELLSLSACQTAEGDDRSPLGIAGAAIKARARSVVATLWGVEDNSARIAMEKFYQGLLVDRMSKAQALRQSQIELLRSDEYGHPFFWAPFVLIGNWL